MLETPRYYDEVLHLRNSLVLTQQLGVKNVGRISSLLNIADKRLGVARHVYVVTTRTSLR